MPAAPAAPPPSAPAAPPPAPKPTSAPPSKPSAPPPPADKDPLSMGDYASEIESMAGEKDSPKQVDRKKPAKPADKPAAEVKPPADSNKPAEGKGEAEPAAPAEQTSPEPTSVPEIRKAYTALKKKAQEEYEPKIQHLESRVKELESSNPVEVKTLQSRLEAAEKRRDELEREIHFVDYSKSTEFREKFQKPYQQAWSKALYEITQLSRVTEDGSTRKATEGDILALANAPLDELDAKASEWFPTSSARVIRHVEKIKDLAEAQSDALEAARTVGAERAKTSDLDRKTATERTLKLLGEAHEAVASKWPQTFGKVEGDDKGNRLLDEGEKMYQKAFNPTDDNRAKDEAEAIQLHAMVRHKVRNHDRIALWLKDARAKIKELESNLAQYENSDPNGGLDGGLPGAAGGIKSEIDSALEEIEQLAKKR